MFYKKYQEVYFLKRGNELCLHFNWLFQAISLVNKNYLNYYIYNDSKNRIEKQYHLERVFAYELYRQWSNILERECDEEVILNAELDKIIEEEIETYNSEKNLVKVRKYPDLVLHHDQGNDDKQKIICEIKRNIETNISGALIMADLYKLTCYMDEHKFKSSKKPFKFGVFILLNGDLELIKSIKESEIIVSSGRYKYKNFKEEMCSHFDNVICVSYDGDKLEYRTLKSILSIKKNL